MQVVLLVQDWHEGKKVAQVAHWLDGLRAYPGEQMAQVEDPKHYTQLVAVHGLQIGLFGET